MTSSDRFPILDRSAVKTNLTDWYNLNWYVTTYIRERVE